MLVEITRVDDFRAMVGWQPDAAATGTPARFGRWSVVYGGNGSGKTTLSELLRLCGGGEPPCAIRVRTWDGTTLASMEVSSARPSLGYAISVFNAEYVRRNLSDFLDGSGACDGLVYIGEASVESARREAVIQENIDCIEKRLAELNRIRAEVETAPRSALNVAKESVISTLEGYDPREYNPTRYNVAKVKANFDKEWCCEVDPAERPKLRKLLATSTLEELALDAYPDLRLDEILSKVNELRIRPIYSSVDPELRDDPDREAWVEKGLELHTEGDACKFCGGSINAEKIGRYAAHFDASLTKLRDDLAAGLRGIADRVDKLKAWRDSIPDSDKLEPRIRDNYKLAVADALNAVSADLILLDELCDAVRERVSAPFAPLKELEVKVRAVADVSSLTDAIATHEKTRTGLATSRTQAARRLHGDALAKHKNAYETAIARQSRHRRAVEVLQRRQAGLRQDLALERESRHDTSKLAIELSADLGLYLGNDQLRIEVSPDGKAYRVLRGDEPAEHLSDGEKNSIALLYFLRSLEESSVDPANTIVVIDDPVSSLDKEAVFAAYSTLRVRLEAYRQAILLTHDFEFFRLWRIGLDNQLRRETKVPSLEHPGVAFLECYARVGSVAGAKRREPRLRALDKAVLKHATEYHYLFSRLAHAVSNTDDPELPLLPNAARRLLEGFLSFKAPSATDLRSRLDQVAADGHIDIGLKDRVYRFANGLSHREEPTPRGGLDFPTIGRELAMVMEFLRQADPEHFRRMERACDVQVPSQTLPGLSNSAVTPGGPEGAARPVRTQ